MPPRTFRKKPVEIQAIQVCEAIEIVGEQFELLPDWLREAYVNQQVKFGADYALIDTLEGQMVGGWNDWIIRGVQGELYPCKDEIFWATYDEVDG